MLMLCTSLSQFAAAVRAAAFDSDKRLVLADGTVCTRPH
jgi:hypothetical protein